MDYYERTLLTLMFLSSMGLNSLHQCTLRSIFSYFEIMKTNDIHVSRIKRNVHGTNFHKAVKFTAFKRNFTIELTNDASIFHPQFQAKVANEDGRESQLTVNQNSFYSGIVKGSVRFEVDAVEMDDVWIAYIQTLEDFYALEPISLYDRRASETEMIFYRGRDIIGNKKLTYNKCWHSWINKEYLQAKKEVNDTNTLGNVKLSPQAMGKNSSVNQDIQGIGINKRLHHRKRQISCDALATDSHFHSGIQRRLLKIEKTMPTDCGVKIVGHHTIFEGIGKRNVVRTAYALIQVFKVVNKIFRRTVFGDLGSGYGVVVKDIFVHAVSSQGNGYNSKREHIWDAHDLLNAFSHRSDNQEYCLVHLATQIILKRNTYGFAAPARPKKWVCGICDTLRNIGLTTVLGHNGLPIPLKSYSLLVAHEIGHNWGSLHDPLNEGSICSPTYAQGGKYIMYSDPSLQSGPNHLKFSPCSIDMIIKVMKMRAHKCFEYLSNSQRCGNGILEAGEECDPGVVYSQTDKCCTKNCFFKPGAKCSPRSQLCCTADCQLASSAQKCDKSAQGSCYEESYCTGNDADNCTISKPLQNGDSCDDGGSCWNGKCLDFCRIKGMEHDPVTDLRRCDCVQDTRAMCRHCCVDYGSTKSLGKAKCIDYGVQKKNGSLCAKGTCIDGICVEEMTFFTLYNGSGSLKTDLSAAATYGWFGLIVKALLF